MKFFTMFVLLLFLSCTSLFSHAQTLNNTDVPESISFIQTDDTLKANTGIIITKGQRIKVGKATGENGWYQSIGFKSFASWPVLFLHDTEIKNQYQGSDNPEQERENDNVKDYLKEGDSLLVTKIKRMGSKRKGYWYWLFLRDTRFPTINYRCNPETGITTKEIIIEN